MAHSGQFFQLGIGCCGEGAITPVVQIVSLYINRRGRRPTAGIYWRQPTRRRCLFPDAAATDPDRPHRAGCGRRPFPRRYFSHSSGMTAEVRILRDRENSW